jgi:hypothetical protein
MPTSCPRPDITRKIIPKRVYLPGHHNLVVTIALLTPTRMRQKYGEYYDGMFDAPNRHIDINRRLALARKWWVFGQLFIQIVGEYWLPWLIEMGIANERAVRIEHTRTPKQLEARRQRARDFLVFRRQQRQRRNAGRMPDQTSERDGREASIHGSMPMDDSHGSILAPR